MKAIFPERLTTVLAAAAMVFGFAAPAHAAVIDVTIDGGDAIHLAGRTDLVIPPAGVPWPGGLARHPITPELIMETLPPVVAVSPGDIVRAINPAVGGISFFNGFGAPLFGPDGGAGGTDIGSFGGISAFKSDGAGPLVGVFLGAGIPAGLAPAALDFTGTGLGTDFLALSPLLGQVFFIGDGKTGGGLFHEFTAPAGATRVAFGIPDGFGFVGVPGAYDDNDGAYRIRIGINEIPTVPEPATLALLALALVGFSGMRLRKRVRA